MLIQFSVRNYKTFRDKATLSLVASSYDKKTREADNVIDLPEHKLRLLKSAVVYGANASGKTKLFDALKFMKKLVRDSADEQKGGTIDVDPFRLSTETQRASSEFEVIFLQDGIRHRYGFEVLADHVVSEWLFYQPKNTEVEVFYRQAQTFDAHLRLVAFKIGKNIAKEGMVKENTLWLSAAGKWNDVITGVVLEWFKDLSIISGIEEEGYPRLTFQQLKNKKRGDEINKFMRRGSFGIEEVGIEEEPSGIGDLIFLHNYASYPQFDSNKNRKGLVNLSMSFNESSGTKQYFELATPILDALANGYILVVDELDSRLHPNLVCSLIELFNSAKSNPNNAQLIFNTHDTNLLSSGLFRRDQIWFTEKDRYGAASLYSLSDFSPRKGEDLEKNYIQGKYGAVPYLGDFENLINPAAQNEE